MFDRKKIKTFPLAERKNKLNFLDRIVDVDEYVVCEDSRVSDVADLIVEARRRGKPVIVAFGAHLIKNGLGPLLGLMVEEGYVTHLATNGAGSIHDWEFAYQGKSGEDVRDRVSNGRFGMGEETGRYINLAIKQGAFFGRGYGESVGKMICENKIVFEDGSEEIVEHPYKKYSLQKAAFDFKVPFTVHPGIGYDIIYTHPLCDEGAIGKTAGIDFLKFVSSVSELEGGGVYLSIGSAIMSPMIFEKSLSMARNVAEQFGGVIRDFNIVVNDIADERAWDFGSGKEPNENDSAYYSRLCKSFDRMGAREMKYVKMDNRDFLVGLWEEFREKVK